MREQSETEFNTTEVDIWVELPIDQVERDVLIEQSVTAAKTYLIDARERWSELKKSSETETKDEIRQKYELRMEQAREAFGTVFLLTRDKMYEVAYPHTHFNRTYAEDALQDAYLRAFRALPKFRQKAAFTTWMHRIVVNSSNDVMAKVRKHSHEELDSSTVEYSLGKLALSQQDTVQIPNEPSPKLVEALRGLRADDREILWLRYVDNVPHKEIAEMKGKSETATKVRLYRAKKRLVEKLALLGVHSVEEAF